MANEASFSHVFLSFRGETRNKFTCFLYDALEAEGFVVLMDKSDIYVGDGVDLRIKDGIKNSLSTIIISPQIMHIQSGALMNVFSSLNATRTLGT